MRRGFNTGSLGNTSNCEAGRNWIGEKDGTITENTLSQKPREEVLRKKW